MSNEPTSDARKIETVVEILRFDDGEAVPHGWKIVRLGDVSNVKTGSRNNQDKVESGQYPFFVRSDVVERIDTYSHECEAIIIPGEGGIGSIFHYINGRFELHQRVYKISNFTANMHGKFIYYAMFQYFGTHAMKHTVKATVDSLRLPTFKNFLFPAPQSRLEQHAIAEALSDVDGLLESLESLIAKKRSVKIGTMQQLLTGKIRLPGFRGEWKTKRLGEIANIDPENLSDNTSPDYEFNYISLEQVETGRLHGYTEETFRSSPSRARRKLRRNDILMATVRPNLMGHLLFNEQPGNTVCSTGFAVLRCKDSLSVPEFLFVHLLGSVVNKQIEAVLSGSNYPAISSSDVALMEIPCPPTVREQAAIATILSDMDAEIATLECRLDKGRALKQGMMQQLLTGKIRLVDPA